MTNDQSSGPAPVESDAGSQVQPPAAPTPSAATPAPEKTNLKQVFIAYSYKLYPKADYRRVYKDLEDQYDVTFIFADEKITNMHIMKKIETFIRGSDFSIFDISGWNPNVALELGFAMPVTDQWYIAIDPSKTDVADVPSDLRGLDRIQYSSYAELGERLAVLIEQRYPRRPRGSIDEFLEDRRRQVREVLKAHPGLTMQALAQLLAVEVPVAQLVVRPMAESGELDTRGTRKSMKYYPKGLAPSE